MNAIDFLYPFLLGIGIDRLWQSGVVHRLLSPRERYFVGGYPSGGKRASELRPPPPGPAPGATRSHVRVVSDDRTAPTKGGA